MIDVTQEKLLSMTEAARSLPHTPHLATLHRWRLRGIRGIRLETILIGGRRFTSVEAMERFFESTTAVADGGVPPARTRRQRERDIARAEAELDRIFARKK